MNKDLMHEMEVGWSNQSVIIKPLCECPEVIPALANLWAKTLNDPFLYQEITEKFIQYFHTHLNTDSLPIAIVAFKNSVPVGVCSLKAKEEALSVIGDYIAPTIGSMVVDVDCRNQGIGKMLVDGVKMKAKQLGFTELYLSAFQDELIRYYANRGFKEVRIYNLKEGPVKIMVTPL